MVAALSALSLTLLGRGRRGGGPRGPGMQGHAASAPSPTPSLPRSRQSPFYPSLDRVHLGPSRSPI